MAPEHSLVVAFILILAVTAPAAAAPAVVQTATICNAGTVPVVAFLAHDAGFLTEDWNVESTVVASRKCSDLSFGVSGEIYLGFALTVNGRLVGQPADNLPELRLVQRAVKHVCLHRTGRTNYHYGVLEPNCATLGSDGPNRGQYVSVDTALLERIYSDPRRPYLIPAKISYTVAPSAADPRLHLTPGMPDGVAEARAAENDARTQQLLNEFLKTMIAEASKTPQPTPAPKTLDQRLEEIDRATVAADSGAPWALPRVPWSGPFEYGKTMMISGTVSRVDVHGQFPTWVTLYLKESPDNALVICSSFPDIFSARLGRGYASSLVGRTVEVQGPITGARCDTGAKAAIQVTMSNQLRIR